MRHFGGGCHRSSSLRALGAFPLPEELQGVHDNLGDMPLLLVAVQILTGAELPLHIYLRPLADIPLNDVCRIALRNEVVPFGVLLEHPSPILVLFRSGEGECCDLDLLVDVSDIWVFPDIADEYNFVDCHIIC